MQQKKRKKMQLKHTKYTFTLIAWFRLSLNSIGRAIWTHQATEHIPN